MLFSLRRCTFSAAANPTKMKYDHLYGLNSCLASLKANRRTF